MALVAREDELEDADGHVLQRLRLRRREVRGEHVPRERAEQHQLVVLQLARLDHVREPLEQQLRREREPEEPTARALRRRRRRRLPSLRRGDGRGAGEHGRAGQHAALERRGGALQEAEHALLAQQAPLDARGEHERREGERRLEAGVHAARVGGQGRGGVRGGGGGDLAGGVRGGDGGERVAGRRAEEVEGGGRVAEQRRGEVLEEVEGRLVDHGAPRGAAERGAEPAERLVQAGAGAVQAEQLRGGRLQVLQGVRRADGAARAGFRFEFRRVRGGGRRRAGGGGGARAALAALGRDDHLAQLGSAQQLLVAVREGDAVERPLRRARAVLERADGAVDHAAVDAPADALADHVGAGRPRARGRGRGGRARGREDALARLAGLDARALARAAARLPLGERLLGAALADARRDDVILADRLALVRLGVHDAEGPRLRLGGAVLVDRLDRGREAALRPLPEDVHGGAGAHGREPLVVRHSLFWRAGGALRGAAPRTGNCPHAAAPMAPKKRPRTSAGGPRAGRGPNGQTVDPYSSIYKKIFYDIQRHS